MRRLLVGICPRLKNNTVKLTHGSLKVEHEQAQQTGTAAPSPAGAATASPGAARAVYPARALEVQPADPARTGLHPARHQRQGILHAEPASKAEGACLP